MKILHFADLHIGVETYGRIDPATGLNTRMLDILTALDKLVDYAIDRQVDLVIFSGDAYKSREPTQTQQREFARRLNRLSTADIPVFLLVGNHDLPNAVGKATSTEIFSTLAVKNIYVSSRPEVVMIPTKSGVIQVASLPWVRRGALLAREDTRGLNIEQINRRLEQSLTGIVKTLADKIDTSLPAILAAHVWVGAPNRKTREGTEKTMTLGQEHSLLASSVANPVFDYVALGHIHVSQILHETPPVVYAGSLVKLDFGDEGDDKGFYEIEISAADGSEHREVRYSFQVLEGRRFLTIVVELEPGDSNPTATIIDNIQKYAEKIQGAIIRLQINVPPGLDKLINVPEIRSALEVAHSFSIAKNVERENRIRLGIDNTETLQPLDALNLFLQFGSYSPDRVEVLLEHARLLLDPESEI